ncbi:MAG: DUF5906 domain-containing protein, partial [Gemmatimonadetes bacterium]|nr:DUF5906 domain-containing protein [Gemmatimonadota bacterium]
ICLEQLGPAPIRSSRDPRKLLPYRTKNPFRKKALQFEAGGKSHAVEVLAEGNQYLVAGTHPSGNDYSWDSPLRDMQPADLTEITEAEIDALLDTLESELSKRSISARRKGSKGNKKRKSISPLGGCTERAPSQEEERGDNEWPDQKSLLAPSLGKLSQIVGLIPNSSKHFPHYDDFIKMAIAIHAASGGDGLEIFQEWASRWEKGNDPSEVESAWNTLSPPFRIGFLRLQGFARDLGGYEWAADEFPEEASERERELSKLNATYAVVQVGRNVVILQERGEELEFLRRDDFRLKLKPFSIPSLDGKKQLSLADAWIGWEGRREYERVVFKPGIADTKDEYNLWRGWAVESNPYGDCTIFLDHLKDIVCNGDEEHFNWLLDWMADIIQNPMEKPGTAVALQGGQGAGKSIVGATMKALLGKHQMIADQPRQVTGQFNAHLEYCLLLQSDEGFWAGGKSDVGRLKNLVTGETLQIERKGIDSVESPNFLRLLITSNEDWVWPTDVDDRRLVIFRVSGTRVGDREYFHRLLAQLKAGGYGKLLHILETRDIEGWRRREPPKTEAFLAQVSESLTPEDAWVLQLLNDGELYSFEGLPGGGARVPLAVLYDSYSTSLGDRKYKKSEAAFAFLVQDELQGVKTGDRMTVDTEQRFSVRSMVYHLPPLDELRKWYSQTHRGAPLEWDGDAAWTQPSPRARLLGE